MELASIITTNRETTEVVTNKYQMQDISNVSHRDAKPSTVDPSPSLETTFTPVVSHDNNNVNTNLRAGNDTDLDVLGQYINEPGPNRVYHHIMREILNITPGGILDKLIVARLRGRQDPISLKYFVMDLDRNDFVNYDWICSLKEDGIIDKGQLDELLIIDSYLNHMQNRTGPISDGYADITKCTRDDFVVFSKWTQAMVQDYDEEKASASEERGKLPTLQIQNLYGLRKDSIDCSSNRLDIGINTYMEGAGDINGEGLLRVKWGCAASNIQRMWKGWYVRKLIKSKSADDNLIVPDAISIEDGMPIINWGDSGDIVPTTEDHKVSILADTDKVGINLLGNSELNNGDSVELLIADEININLPDEIDINSPIMTGPDAINSADATLSSKNDIASKISAANKCRNAADADLEIIRKAKRREEKKTRRDFARDFTGSGRLYHKAVSKVLSSVIIIQKYTRMYRAKKKVNLMRGGPYRRRANGSHTGCNDCNPQVQDNSDVSDQTPSATTSTARYTVPGTRRISAQASIFSQQSFYITLSYDPLSMIGENGEMTYDAGDTGSNVFAIPTRDRDTLSPPKVFSIRGEEPSTKFYIRPDGEFVCKVEVDRGAWGEYDDNPIDVMDWQQIMLEVRKFAGRAFVLHVEIKLNHQLEMTPWTREEGENNGNGTLNDIHINSSGVIGDMSNVFSSKAYETICNSLSVVNHTNIQTVIARIDKNIPTLAGDLRDGAVLLTKHNTLDTQQDNHSDKKGWTYGSGRSGWYSKHTPGGYANFEQFRNGNFFGTL